LHAGISPHFVTAAAIASGAQREIAADAVGQTLPTDLSVSSTDRSKLIIDLVNAVLGSYVVDRPDEPSL
jgi:hypothetical protein